MQAFGSHDIFSIAFELRPDPDESATSWGALEVWVAGRCLTRGYSKDRDWLPEVEVPLEPVLRWVLTSWDALFHEERLPALASRSATSMDWYLDVLHDDRHESRFFELLSTREQWWKRHALGSAVPGFRIPDIHLRRFRQSVEVSWSDAEWRTCGPGARMLESPGAALVDIDHVTSVLADWCTALLVSLESRAEMKPQYADLRALLEDLRSPSRQLARLRLDVREWLDATVDQLRKRAGVTDGNREATMRALLGARPPGARLYEVMSVPGLLFRSAAPQLSSNDVQQLLDLCSASARRSRLQEFQSSAVPTGLPMDVTEDGYARALEFRAAWKVPAEAPMIGEHDLETKVLPALDVRVVDVLLEDRGTDGASVFGDGLQPTMAVNRHGRFARTRNGRRMTLAHELCHLLHDVEHGQVGIVSGPWAPTMLERRANAFAAMLLAPEPVLAATLPSDVGSWTRNDLEQAMARIGVGVYTLTWQLYNLGWISESERHAWVDELTQ